MSDLQALNELYDDVKACARVVGLRYIHEATPGLERRRRGKGFSYYDNHGHVITAKAAKQRIAELVIPPAWQAVWICPSDNGHILATGIDERGRKQYIYHPKWRTMRDLLKFYRLLLFARALPDIRRTIDRGLRHTRGSRKQVLATMLWLLDNTYLRIGNELYLTENDSVGLTTLGHRNVVVAGSVSTLSFRAKSGKRQQITFDNQVIADILGDLAKAAQPRLFSYQADGGWHPIEASELNHYLQDVTGQPISAKDFRTWGGTLLAFNHLVSLYKRPATRTPKPAKAAVQAIDAAANTLGNTRAVAKSSYIHPHILQAYAEKDFATYYEIAKAKRPRTNLDKRESELVSVLEQLFEAEFSLLQKSK
jgi:DNA topoisomerase-1